MWLVNIRNPPPRPEPGSTVQRRPYAVSAGDPVIIERSDEFAWEATVTTPALPGATQLSGVLGTAPLPSEVSGPEPSSSAVGSGLPEIPELLRAPVRSWHGDAFPDPLKMLQLGSEQPAQMPAQTGMRAR
jgi:hypothetical protein